MIKPHNIIGAHKRLRPYIKPSPLVYSEALSARSGANVWLKLECRQPTGSFKIRGATFKMMQLGAQAETQGVVTASAGNHGLGTAFAARALGVSNVTIFVPQTTPQAKITKLQRFPIQLRQVGQSYNEAHHAAEQFSKETGAIYLPAYNDLDVITGAGTIGLEIMNELPETESIIVPIGGGGLVSGIGVAVKGIFKGCDIIGAQPENSPSAKISFEQNLPVEDYEPAAPTIADGLSGGFGSYPFYLCRTLIEEILLFSEAELRQAVFTLIDQEQLVVEASGAISIAPLLRPDHNLKGKTVVAVVCGANIDSRLLADILQEHLATN